MQLDNLLRAVDPARQARIEQTDSPSANALYRRIIGTSPTRGGGGVPGIRGRRGPQGSPVRRLVSHWEAWVVVATAAIVAAGIGIVGLAGGWQQPHASLAGGGVATGPRLPGQSRLPAAPGAHHSPHLSARPALPRRLNKAGSVLDALAATAASSAGVPQHRGHGKYLYVLDIELKGAPPGGGKADPCGSVIRQMWLAPDNSGRQVGRMPGCTKLPGFRQTFSGGKDGDGDIYFDYLGWRGLPTKPAALEAAIVNRFEGGKTNNGVTFLLASDILNIGAPPSMRTALFRMLARLPHVRNFGQVTDPLGRTGDTIGQVTKRHGDWVAMFDPATSQVLDAIYLPRGTHLSGTTLPFSVSPIIYLKVAKVGSTASTPPGVKQLLREIPYKSWV